MLPTTIRAAASFSETPSRPPLHSQHPDSIPASYLSSPPTSPQQMASSLYLSEALVEKENPCSKCGTIGINTACLLQLENPQNLSCLGHNIRVQYPRGSTPDPSQEMWSRQYHQAELEKGREEGYYLCAIILHHGKSNVRKDGGVVIKLMLQRFVDIEPCGYYLSLEADMVSAFGNCLHSKSCSILSYLGRHKGRN